MGRMMNQTKWVLPLLLAVVLLATGCEILIPPDPGVVVTASQEEVSIINYWFESGVRSTTMIGQAKNVSGRMLTAIYVKARMLDSAGLQVKTRSSSAYDVAPGMMFAFDYLTFSEDNVRTIEIYEITTYDF